MKATATTAQWWLLLSWSFYIYDRLWSTNLDINSSMCVGLLCVCLLFEKVNQFKGFDTDKNLDWSNTEISLEMRTSPTDSQTFSNFTQKCCVYVVLQHYLIHIECGKMLCRWKQLHSISQSKSHRFEDVSQCNEWIQST